MDEFSEQMKRAIARLRRRVNDNSDDDEQRFTDEDLYGYISDAVDELEMGDYQKHIYVENGDFLRSGSGQPANVTNQDIAIYTLKAQILLKTGLKDQADRDNFSLRKNNLSVDTTRQSVDHADSLEILEKELNKMLYRSNVIVGVRVE